MAPVVTDRKDRPENYLGRGVSRTWLTESRGSPQGLMVPIGEREDTGGRARFGKGAYLHSEVRPSKDSKRIYVFSHKIQVLFCLSEPEKLARNLKLKIKQFLVIK